LMNTSFQNPYFLISNIYICTYERSKKVFEKIVLTTTVKHDIKFPGAVIPEGTVSITSSLFKKM